MRLDLSRENGYQFTKDDQEGNAENMKNMNDEIRYGCYYNINIDNFFMTNVM